VIEGVVEASGARLRYLETGGGAPLLHVQPAGALRLTPGHERLGRHFRVIALELPGAAPIEALTQAALPGLGLDAFELIGSAQAAGMALRLALAVPERIHALVLDSPDGEREADLERRLRGFTVPTLVLVGTRDEPSTQENARAFEALLPNSHLVFVYDAARPIGDGRPEAFAEVVDDFLDRHDAFVVRRTPARIHP